MTCDKCIPPKFGTSLRLVIGDRPSPEDAINGMLFSDGYGRVLDMLLRKAGIRREEVTLVTVIPYLLPEKVSEAEKQTAIKHGMREHVLPVLHARPWTRVDLIGELPLHIVGQKRESIFTWRGSPIEIDIDKLDQIYGA
jgi:uracil-DNA glycosylase